MNDYKGESTHRPLKSPRTERDEEVDENIEDNIIVGTV